MKYVVRRYKDGDETEIVNLIHRASMEVNIKDYPIHYIEKLCKKVNKEFIKKRSKLFHTYVVLHGEKIIGVGTIGPYWDSTIESSLFNIFVLPEYQNQGVGRLIINELENDDYYKRADRIEIVASITAVEFYKHMGYGFKETDEMIGHIVDADGHYKMEKYPKINENNVDNDQYNMRPYIDNDFYNYKEFVYQVKKNAYKKYVEEIWGTWDEEVQRELYEKFINHVQDDAWIIQLNGKDIGFYNGETLEDGSYEIGNICIIPEYQGRGIGTQVLKDIMKLHKNQNLHIQYFKQNPVGKLYKRLGFVPDYEKEYHYVMKKDR